MIDKFQALPEEKRLAIMNAGYKVFASVGYRLASTNTIIKEAGISKGLLFHYFKTKLNLFTYLYETGNQLIASHIYEALPSSDTDLFVRLKHVALIKLSLAQTYPELFKFITVAYFDQDPEIIALIQPKNQAIISEAYQRLMSGIDLSLFKEDLDMTLVMTTINGTLQQFSESYIGSLHAQGIYDYDLDTIAAKLDTYFAFFKQIFYK